jgi:hypothetical protein
MFCDPAASREGHDRSGREFSSALAAKTRLRL